MTIYARLIGIAAILLLLAGGAWKCYTAGKKNERAEWIAKELATSEAARLRERAAQIQNERIDRDYQISKARAAADKRITDDRLREFATASADSTTSTASGIDDPYRAIANQCAVALAGLDEYAKQVAGKATALQGYAREVCLK